MPFIKKNISLCVAVLVCELINPRWIKSILHRRSLRSHSTPRGLSFSVTALWYTLICIQWFIARFGFISLSYICLSNEMKRQSYISHSRTEQLYDMLSVTSLFHYSNMDVVICSDNSDATKSLVKCKGNSVQHSKVSGSCCLKHKTIMHYMIMETQISET